jgi:hypothetical protein
MKWKQEPYRARGGGYISEFEQFLNSYMAGHPGLERDQQRGWYIWWDHRVNLDDEARVRTDTVPVHSYYYE